MGCAEHVKKSLHGAGGVGFLGVLSVVEHGLGGLRAWRCGSWGELISERFDSTGGEKGGGG